MKLTNEYLYKIKPGVKLMRTANTPSAVYRGITKGKIYTVNETWWDGETITLIGYGNFRCSWRNFKLACPFNFKGIKAEGIIK